MDEFAASRRRSRRILEQLGRGLFALGAAGLGAWSLAFGDFAPLGQVRLAGIHGRAGWVVGSALLLLGAAAGLCVRRTAGWSALVVAVYLAVWVLGCAAVVAQTPLSLGSGYGVCEALTPMLGAGILCAQDPAFTVGRALRAAQVLFGLNCIVYGAAHFVYSRQTAGMVPFWVPDPLAVAYATGVAHLAAGTAIAIGRLAGLAATLEACMMTLFGLLVWAPSVLERPVPAWASPPRYQWSEIVVTLLLAASAWVVAGSLAPPVKAIGRHASSVKGGE